MFKRDRESLISINYYDIENELRKKTGQEQAWLRLPNGVKPLKLLKSRQEDKKKTYAILELDDDKGIECRFDSID